MSEWRRVTDELPDGSRTVLAWSRDNCYMTTATYGHGPLRNEWKEAWENVRIADVSHWTLLPEPPQE